MGLLRYDTQFWDSLIPVWLQKSHIPLPRMKKPRARNGNVMRNSGGNRLEGKHTYIR